MAGTQPTLSDPRGCSGLHDLTCERSTLAKCFGDPLGAVWRRCPKSITMLMPGGKHHWAGASRTHTIPAKPSRFGRDQIRRAGWVTLLPQCTFELGASSKAIRGDGARSRASRRSDLGDHTKGVDHSRRLNHVSDENNFA